MQRAWLQLSLVFAAVSQLLLSTSEPAEGAPYRTGVFGGGPFYNQPDLVIPAMRRSGFATIVLWTLHITSNGDLVFNDTPLISNGRYVAAPSWPAQIAALKSAPTSVNRLEWSIGSADAPDFEHIRSLAAAGAIKDGGILQRNFAALKATFPALDAINYDDESAYDVPSTVDLSLMLGKLKLQISFVPYTASTYWQNVFRQSNAVQPGLVDRIYLQTYDGGTGNVPADWNSLFPGIAVEAGFWSRHDDSCQSGSSPAEVASQIASWRTTISGAWLWLLDDLMKCENAFPIEDYVRALRPNDPLSRR